MRTIKLFISSIAFFAFGSIKAQQVVNLTTGTSPVGTADPLWQVDLPTPGTNFVPAFVSNGNLSNGVMILGAWPNDPCGDWISPHTNLVPGPMFGSVLGAPGLIGNYTYRMSFDITDPCPISNGVLNLNLAGGDNNLTTIIINNTVYPIAGVGFNPLSAIGPLNVTGALLPGTNTIDIVVNNLSSYTGLFLCGNLTIDFNGEMSPVVNGPTAICFGEPLAFDGFASTGIIQNYFWEIAECDAQGTYTNPNAVWNNWFAGTPGSFPFSPSFLQCNKYYRVKLAVSNSCTPWVETTNIFFIHCNPIADAGPDQIICPNQNDGSVTIGTTDYLDADWTYNWSPSQTASQHQLLTDQFSPTPGVTFCLGDEIGCVRDGSCSAWYWFTLTVTNDFGCSATDIVKVTYINQGPSPVSITSTKDLCLGTTLKAIPNCDAAVTYLWSPGGETTQSINVNPSVATTYTVQISSPCFPSASASAVVQPNHVLTGAFPPLTSYTWATPSVPMVIFDDNLYTPYLPYAYNAYEYMLTIWDRWGNVVKQVADVAPMNSTGFWNGEIQWDATNTAGECVQVDTYVYGLRLRNCSSHCFDFSNPGSPDPINNVWEECDVPICVFIGLGEEYNDEDNFCENNNLPIITAPDGTKGCRYCDYRQFVDVIGCDDRSKVETISRPEEESNTIIAVAPNPSSGSFTITSQNQNLGNIKITDMLGHIVYQKSNVNSSSMNIELTGVPMGIYLVEVIGLGQSKPWFSQIVIE